jgi:hypothetical protein
MPGVRPRLPFSPTCRQTQGSDDEIENAMGKYQQSQSMPYPGARYERDTSVQSVIVIGVAVGVEATLHTTLRQRDVHIQVQPREKPLVTRTQGLDAADSSSRNGLARLTLGS